MSGQVAILSVIDVAASTLNLSTNGAMRWVESGAGGGRWAQVDEGGWKQEDEP